MSTGTELCSHQWWLDIQQPQCEIDNTQLRIVPALSNACCSEEQWHGQAHKSGSTSRCINSIREKKKNHIALTEMKFSRDMKLGLPSKETWKIQSEVPKHALLWKTRSKAINRPCKMTVCMQLNWLYKRGSSSGHKASLLRVFSPGAL